MLLLVAGLTEINKSIKHDFSEEQVNGTVCFFLERLKPHSFYLLPLWELPVFRSILKGPLLQVH